MKPTLIIIIALLTVSWVYTVHVRDNRHRERRRQEAVYSDAQAFVDYMRLARGRKVCVRCHSWDILRQVKGDK